MAGDACGLRSYILPGPHFASRYHLGYTHCAHLEVYALQRGAAFDAIAGLPGMTTPHDDSRVPLAPRVAARTMMRCTITNDTRGTLRRAEILAIRQAGGMGMERATRGGAMSMAAACATQYARERSTHCAARARRARADALPLRHHTLPRRH